MARGFCVSRAIREQFRAERPERWEFFDFVLPSCCFCALRRAIGWKAGKVGKCEAVRIFAATNCFHRSKAELRQGKIADEKRTENNTIAIYASQFRQSAFAFLSAAVLGVLCEMQLRFAVAVRSCNSQLQFLRVIREIRGQPSSVHTRGIPGTEPRVTTSRRVS